jgi:WhiB family redox-sensing transcriptional regulator
MSRGARPEALLDDEVADAFVRLMESLSDPDESWREAALCAQTDPEAFYPEKGGSTREAKRICQGCEVRVECLARALRDHERFGIWGGMSERERRKLGRVIREDALDVAAEAVARDEADVEGEQAA